MRALVIDDSRAMRTILRRMLAGMGFEVHEAGDGREGLEQLEAIGTADVVMVDWNLPEMNGYEFVCAVRARSTYDSIRLVMVTTETEERQMSKALAAGADEYVMKPFTKEMIEEKLKSLELLPEGAPGNESGGTGC